MIFRITGFGIKFILNQISEGTQLSVISTNPTSMKPLYSNHLGGYKFLSETHPIAEPPTESLWLPLIGISS